MGMKTIVGNPFSAIEYPKKIEPVLMNYSPFLAVAAGLALLGFEEE